MLSYSFLILGTNFKQELFFFPEFYHQGVQNPPELSNETLKKQNKTNPENNFKIVLKIKTYCILNSFIEKK